MTLFQTIVHPTDFDEPSKEAFRVTRSLAHALGARLVVFHVVPPPAVVAQDGRVVRDPKDPEPIDLWPEANAKLLRDRGRVDGRGRVHLVERPDQIVPIVCGGLGSLHAIALPSFGESTMQSKPVVHP